MKNQNLTNEKKLNKKQLSSITGGLLDCLRGSCSTVDECPPLNEYGCTTISKACFQPQCRN